MKVQLNVLMTLHTTILLCPIDGVYKALNHMSGDEVFTHQIPRVMREVKESKILETTFPKLLECPAFVFGDSVPAYLEACEKVFGGQAEFELPVLSKDQHESIDPVSELAEKVHPDKILVVDPKK